MTKPIDECRTVAELLEDPARWCQGSQARTARRTPTGATAPNACAWCVYGAIIKIYRRPDDTDTAARKLSMAVLFPLRIFDMDLPIGLWNDSRTHAEVLEAVRKAGI